MPALRVKLSADDQNCVDAPLNPTLLTVWVCRISLGGEGNVLYPVLSSSCCLLASLFALPDGFCKCISYHTCNYLSAALLAGAQLIITFTAT